MGMKRAASDDAVYSTPSRKVSRLNKDDYNVDSFDAPSEDDEEYSPSRRLNPSRRYRDEPQRSADRLGVRIHNPKTFGAIPGIPIGTIWEKRMDCSTDAVHAPTVAGISGNEEVGCWSICLSGGYEDDIDLGETFTYTGSGGRDLKGTASNPKNLRTAPQSSDQKWEGKNAALKRSVQTKKPVRVVRGYKANNRYAPREQGYVYSGLYRVCKAWMERGQAGFMVCRFKFERLAGQEELPTFDDEEQEDEGEEEEEEQEEEVAEVQEEVQQQDEEEVEVLSPRAVRASKRTKSPASSSLKQASPIVPTTTAASSPSPAPSARSVRSTSSTSPHPILKSSSEFDRASYIIIDDSEDEEAEEEQEVLLQLEVESANMEEKVVRRGTRTLRRSRRAQ